MSIIYRIRAIFTLTFKRLWAQKGLTTAVILGITAAVALIMVVPLYADAVYLAVLAERIDENSTRRPPFAYLYDYVGAWYDPVSWETADAATQYLSGVGQRTLGLPVQAFTAHFETDKYKLFPAESSSYDDEAALDYFVLGAATGLADHVEMVDGVFPTAVPPDFSGPLPVMMAEAAAQELGVQAGETFTLYNVNEADNTPRQIPVQISGVWRPADAGDPYWFFTPDAFDDTLFVPPETFAHWLAPQSPAPVHRAVWYLVLDGSRVTTEDADRLISGANRVERRLNSLLPNTSGKMTPVDALVSYRRSVRELRVLLAAFNVPVVGLVLAFIILIVGLAVDQRRNEIAVMRGRGATPWQIMGFALAEGLVLGVLAFALGTAAALLLASFMGKTRSFLDFSGGNWLTITLNRAALRAGLLAIGLALLAQFIPTLSASRDTIISYKQEQARAFKKPWWQRAWIDGLLFALTVYGFYLLRQQGQLIAIGDAQSGDPFKNPLLFLLPTLAILSLTLLFVRVFPWLMEAASWLLTQTNSVGLLLAGRELARTPGAYAMPLILLILTVSLAAFTASLAYTVDLQLYDEALYGVGSNVNLWGAGRSFGGGAFSQLAGGDGEGPGRAIYLPLDEYREFPGVVSAARVGEFPATAQVGGSRVNGSYVGVDRGSFSETGFWRWDFSGAQLNALMNSLASSPEAILVSSDFMRENGLRPGDLFRLTVNTADGSIILDTQIVGSLDYFPTWYPEEDGPLFVGNLETLFTLTGGEFPYDVWLRTEGPVDAAAFDQALRDRHLFGWRWQSADDIIQLAQARPERQGLFGQLSVGFVAAALLTVLGYFMYALFSFRRRFVSLGILRAVGLSMGQMAALVAGETAVLILSGLTLGTLFGVWVSKLFIPYLQTGRSASDLVPPYLVEIAWPAIYQIYGLFLLLFVAALLLLAVLLRRMKIFQAIKLGESV